MIPRYIEACYPAAVDGTIKDAGLEVVKLVDNGEMFLIVGCR